MRPDSAVVFGDKAQGYANHRPDHPEIVIEALTARFRPGSVFADIGAGTGRLSQRLAQAGFVVKLVEPNPQMRSLATARLQTLDPPSAERITLLAGEAKQTQLADNSIDCLIAGNSAHWFLDDLNPTLSEFKRVLKPEGCVAIVYTLKDESHSFTQALDAMLRQQCADYCNSTIGFVNHRFNSPNLAIGIAAHYLRPPVERVTHRFHQHYSWTAFEQLLRTYSFFPRQSISSDALLCHLRTIFNQYAEPQTQTVDVSWSTHLQIGALQEVGG